MFELEELSRYSEDVELQDLGYTLPVGFWQDDIKYQYYQTQKFTGNTEILLAELEDRYKNIPNPYNLLYGFFLDKFITHLDNKPLDFFSGDVFQEFYLADIIALVLKIRLEHQGRYLGINSVCPCDMAYEIHPNEAGEHDLGSLKITLWHHDRSPSFRYGTGEQEWILEPPKFKDIKRFHAHQDLAPENRIALVCSGLEEAEFYDLPRCDRANLVYWSNKIANFSADNKLEMSCPKCLREWDAPLILGENYEHFYFNLLAAPRPKDGTVEEYLDAIAQMLTIGENAPLKSLQEVYQLTPSSRNRWIKTMEKFYADQKKAMDKAKSK